MLFEPRNRSGRSDDWKRRYAWYEIAYTLVDFGAALSFIIGSILFFFEAAQVPATVLFLVGSILFACKPTIRLVREIRLARHGDIESLAKPLEVDE